MPEDDILAGIGESFGFEGWNLGIGFFGNLMLFIVLSLFLCIFLGFFVFLYFRRRIYKHHIQVLGIMGNVPSERWKDRAKEIPLGRAGDKLFYLAKKKRFLPPPTIQVGLNKWLYWEREDGELINIGYADLDKQMKQLGLHFVDTDMRMQRLGIEKNLQYRLQKEEFWQKYGHVIINFVFYFLLMIILVVLFVQLAKVADSLNRAVLSASDTMEKVCGVEGDEASPHVPESGLLPVSFLPLIGGIG